MKIPAPSPVRRSVPASLFALCTACSVLLGLPAQAQERPDTQELADRWTLAYNAHNPAELAGLYAEDAQLMMHGAPTIVGRQAIGDFWVMDFTEENPITTLQVTHALEGVDMVLVHGNYQVINRNDGILQGQGRFAHLWRLEEGGEWLLDRDLWNEPFEAYPTGGR